MVVDLDSEQGVDRLFHALADGTRRDIVRRVILQELSVSELARTYPMSITAVQKHVAVLEEAGLVVKNRTGREQRVQARLDALTAAHRLFDEMETAWRGRVGRMAELLAHDDEGEG